MILKKIKYVRFTCALFDSLTNYDIRTGPSLEKPDVYIAVFF